MFENPQAYLDSKLEPSSEERKEHSRSERADASAQQERLNNLPESGTFECTVNDVHICCTFDLATEENIPSRLMRKLIGTNPDDCEPPATPWRVLTSLEIKRNNTSVDLIGSLPEGVPVVFQPVGEKAMYMQWGDERMVVVQGDIGNPHTLFSLAHEIGHVVVDEGLDPVTRTEMLTARSLYNRTLSSSESKERLTPEEAAYILYDERSSSAFALRALRPFIGKDGLMTREDVLAEVHEPLGSYSDHLRKHTKFPSWLQRLFAKYFGS